MFCETTFKYCIGIFTTGDAPWQVKTKISYLNLLPLTCADLNLPVQGIPCKGETLGQSNRVTGLVRFNHGPAAIILQ